MNAKICYIKVKNNILYDFICRNISEGEKLQVTYVNFIEPYNNDFITDYLVQKQQASLTGRPTTLEYKKFQDFLESMGLILNLIQGHSTILYLKRETVRL